MYRILPTTWVFGLLTILTLASQGVPQQPIAPTPESPALQDPIEPLTRGPLHEAFAQPVQVQPEPGTAVPREPPAPIPEEPPEQQPEAGDAQWIPGYWAWDAERQDYLWVSGVYRVAPQGRTFVPGYWTQTQDGWRWVSGFWASQRQDELPYVPEPPAPLDNGPNLPAPDDNSIYIPGSWVYRETRYLWRPGYWAAGQLGRVWVSPQYQWTPRGYLFLDGYWDYPLESRGLVFAPVYFHRPLWQTNGWAYRPNHVVSFSLFFDSCFVRGGSFYFGNYYGNNFARLGYNPWYAGRGRYDPTFAYHGWQNQRNNPNWFAGVQQTYRGRANGQLAAPPATFAQQNALHARNANAVPVIAPLPQGAARNQVRLVKTSPTQFDTQKAFAQHTREIGQNRSRLGEARSLNLPSVLQTKSGSQGLGAPIPSRTPISESTSNPGSPRIVNEVPRSGNLPPFKGDPSKGVPRVENRNFAPSVNIGPKVENRQFAPPINNLPKQEIRNFVPPQANQLPKVENRPFAPPINNLPKQEIRNFVPPQTNQLPKVENRQFAPPINNLPKQEIRNFVPPAKSNPPKQEMRNFVPPAKSNPPKMEIRNVAPPTVTPRNVPSPSAPKFTPAPRVNNPPPAKQASSNFNAPRTITKSPAPAPRHVTAPTPAPRVISAPPQRSNHAPPAKTSSPPPRPTNNKKR